MQRLHASQPQWPCSTPPARSSRCCCPHLRRSRHHIHLAAASTVSSGVPKLELPAPLQGTMLRFPHLGSGLLFARSTGLKLWPGAQLLAHFMLQPPADIVAHHPALAAAFLQGSAASVASPAAAAAVQAEAAAIAATAAECGMPEPWAWTDKRVLGLGCGLGLCSTVAALLGAHATATDGDADVVAVTKRNARVNVASGSTRHALTTAQLRWGDANALSRLGFSERSKADVVLMSDVVYGSDPGVWEALVGTLAAAAGEQTLVLQAETPRVETPDDYAGYWECLGAAGFSWKEVEHSTARQQGSVQGGGGIASSSTSRKARLWLVHRSSASASIDTTR